MASRNTTARSQLPYIPNSEVEAAAAALARQQPTAAAKTESVPAVYGYFTLVKKGTHMQEPKNGGEAQELPCEWWQCKKAGHRCKVKGSPPIKVVKKGTGGLLRHVRACEGEEAWLQVRSKSKGSKVFTSADGRLLTKLSFEELLPHHAQFVIYCFKAWDKFSKTRSPDFRAYIEGWEVRAALPARETCIKLLFIIKHLIKRSLHSLLSLVKKMIGSPCCGLLDDIWSKRNCKQSFACARIPLCIDGELLDKFLTSLRPSARPQYTGTVVSCSPLLTFSTLPSSRHSGHVIARWKTSAFTDTGVLTIKDVSLATEDGASNNKKSNRILRLPSVVCYPHDLQRCVLFGSGLTGKPCQNAPLRDFQARSSKMVGCFSRSGVATSALMDAQREDHSWDKVLGLASPNVTRWLGLHRQSQRNRELQPNICKALCGVEIGVEDEMDPEVDIEGLSDSGSSRSGNSEEEEDKGDIDDDAVEAAVRANKEFPLMHRLLTNDDFSLNCQYESVLASPAEVSALLQSHDGTRLEEAHTFMATLAQTMETPRLQVVSGRGQSESWDEIPATRLNQMFKDFRRIFVEQATQRFQLNGTPNEHVLLCLKMSPFIDSSPDGEFGKRATQELMAAVYKTKLRSRQLHLLSQTPSTSAAATTNAGSPAPPANPAPQAAHGATTAGKKRQKIGALATTMYAASNKAAEQDASDQILKAEIEAYEKICSIIDHLKYLNPDAGRYDLNQFWAEHKKKLPIHYLVYLGDCASKRAASASVETVYSGATKLADGSEKLADDVLAAYIYCHYNFKFEFLRPTIDEIVAEYKKAHGNQPPEDSGDEEAPDAELIDADASDADADEDADGS